MFSHRRIRLVLIAVVALVVLSLYYSGEARKVQNQEFYKSTVKAIEVHRQEEKITAEKGSEVHHNAHPPSQTQHQIQGSHEEGLKKPDGKEKEVVIPKEDGEGQDQEDMEEISIAGRTKMSVPKNRHNPDAEKSPQVAEENKEEEHDEAKEELNVILKRSPVIVFSKSYCPYSKKAKSILLDKYSIVPAPFVVELDQHPIGKKLQDLLAQHTGRRTVPNILVSGKSIGGGDDMAALDESNELALTLKTLGGKWLVEVEKKGDHEQEHA